MTACPPDMNDVLARCESWVVMATGVFITCCRTGNFSPVDLARQPVLAEGRIKQGIAETIVPKWFPLQDAIFQSGDGTLYCRVGDLPVKKNAQSLDANNIRATLDLRPLPSTHDTFSLIYFPWFRFLAEPVNFDAVGKVAAYISDCLLFLMKKQGMSTTRTLAGNSCHLVTTDGFEVTVTGQERLSRLSLIWQKAETIFDLERRSIQIDQRMFPAAYQAARQVVTEGDKLDNASIVVAAPLVTLNYSPEGGRV